MFLACKRDGGEAKLPVTAHRYRMHLGMYASILRGYSFCGRLLIRTHTQRFGEKGGGTKLCSWPSRSFFCEREVLHIGKSKFMFHNYIFSIPKDWFSQ